MKKILQFDLARGRVPRPETVFRIADLLIPHGLGGILFYLENTVENTVFPSAGAGKNPVTQEYLKQVRSFCESRGIEFIPHFELFSHQENLLALPEMEQYGDTENAHCFRLDLPELREKIKARIGEISSCFSSPYIHCGGDEAFTLGLGRSRAFFEKNGFENAFADFVNEVNAYIRSIGKIMLLYADTPIVYPGLAEKLDKEIIMVNWAYCIRNEVYEKENYHYCRHDIGVAGHRFWVTNNCMAEYVFTPFYRLEENTAIWRELGANAEALVISDWGSDQNVNPFVLTLLGALFALHSFENPSYTQDDFLKEAERMILGAENKAFRDAYRILLNASGPEYWSSDILFQGTPLPSFLFEDPDSRTLCVKCGMADSAKLEQLESDVRKAVSLLTSIDSASAKHPDLLNDLKALSKRVLATAIRARMCYRYAHDTGGIWFTQPELEPRIRQYEEYVSLMRDDLAFLISNWHRDSFDTCLDRAVVFYEKAITSTKKTLRLPENTLRVFPPKL